MKFYESGVGLAPDVGKSVSKVKVSIEAHFKASLENFQGS